MEDWDWVGGTDGLAVNAVAHMDPPEELFEESLLFAYILLLLVLVQMVDGSTAGDLIAAGDGLGGGTPQSVLLPQTTFDDCG